VIANINDGSGNPPRLRVDLNFGNLWELPDWSSGPTGSTDEVLAAIALAGFEGLQGGDPPKCAKAGLASTAFGLVRQHEGTKPADLAGLAAMWRDFGNQCATLHLGTGLESDDDAHRLIESVLEASASTGFPLYVETHRATLTQDLWRTVQFVERYPELRFNGDFSHWYTGLEWTYGDPAAKREFAAPVLDRVCFMHGRIGSTGSIQIDVGPEGDHEAVAEFRLLWTAAMRGFQASANPGDLLVFAPELLPSSINYARTVVGPDGESREESDRWEQALVLARIARECWDASSY